MDDPDDGELLTRHLAGDPEAFAALVRRHAGMVAGVARRVLGQAEGVDDVVQATFLVLIREGRRLRPEPSLGGWLHRVGRNLAGNARARRRPQAGLHLLDPRADPRPQRDEARRELHDDLDAALASLPERYRTPLVLHHLEGLSHEAIAVRLGATPGTVASWLSRGRERLRTALAKRGVAASSALLGSALATLASAPPAAAEAVLVQPTPSALLLAKGTAMPILSAPLLVACAGAVLAAVVAVAPVGASAEQPHADAAEPAPAPVIPDPEANAALDYWRAFALLPTSRAERDRLAKAEPAEAETLLGPGALRLLRIGARQPYCAWGVDVVEEGGDALLPQITKARDLARLGLLSARHLAALDRDAEAVVDVIAVMTLGRHLRTARSALIEQLVGASIEQQAVTVAARILIGLDAASRASLSAGIGRLPEGASAPQAIAIELDLMDHLLARLRAIPPAQRPAEMQALVKPFRHEGDGPVETLLAVARQLPSLGDDGLARTAARLQDWRERLRALATRPAAEHDTAALSAPFPIAEEPLFAMIAPTLGPVLASLRRPVRYQTALGAALAVLSRGDAALAEHPDPVSGKPLAITRQGEGFTLSDVGADALTLVVGEDGAAPAASDAGSGF